MVRRGKKDVASAEISCVSAEYFSPRIDDSNLHFLWLLKLKCACLIFFFVPCLGALALFTGVSCS